LSYRRAAELFRVRTGWTLHQQRHLALTHAAEDGTNLPLRETVVTQVTTWWTSFPVAVKL
jgi:hypothetical protein